MIKFKISATWLVLLTLFFIVLSYLGYLPISIIGIITIIWAPIFIVFVLVLMLGGTITIKKRSKND